MARKAVASVVEVALYADEIKGMIDSAANEHQDGGSAMDLLVRIMSGIGGQLFTATDVLSAAVTASLPPSHVPPDFATAFSTRLTALADSPAQSCTSTLWAMAIGSSTDAYTDFSSPAIDELLDNKLKARQARLAATLGTSAIMTASGAAKHNDGANQPSGLSAHVPVTLPTSADVAAVQASLRALPPRVADCDAEQVEALLADYGRDGAARGFAKAAAADGVAEHHVLSLYAYSYESKKRGSALARLRATAAADLVPEVERVQQRRSGKLRRIPAAQLERLRESGADGRTFLLSEGADMAALFGGDAEAAEVADELQDFVLTPAADDSHDWQLYAVVNRMMRSVASDAGADRTQYDCYSDVMAHIAAALRALPPMRSVVFRGISMAISLADYLPGRAFVWPAFSSTSVDAEVGKDFVSGAAEGVLFLVTTFSGRSIERYSRIPGERELLLPENSAFRVRGVAGEGVRRILDVADGVHVIEVDQIDEEEARMEGLLQTARDLYLYERDMSAFDVVIRECPGTHGALFASGMKLLYASPPNAAAAQAYLGQAVDKAPENVTYLKEYAYCLSLLKQYLPADFVYKRALKVDPNNGQLLYSYAWSLADRKDAATLRPVAPVAAHALLRYSAQVEAAGLGTPQVHYWWVYAAAMMWPYVAGLEAALARLGPGKIDVSNGVPQAMRPRCEGKGLASGWTSHSDDENVQATPEVVPTD